MRVNKIAFRHRSELIKLKVTRNPVRFIPMFTSAVGKHTVNYAPDLPECRLYSYARYAIAEALKMSLQSPGEVMVPALCCQILVDVIHASGNRPLFYDVSKDLEIGVDEIETKINNRVVALIAIAYFGWETVNIDQLFSKYGRRIYLLIDAAQGLPMSLENLDIDRVISFRKSMCIPDGACWLSSCFPESVKPRMPKKVSVKLQREANIIREISSRKGSSDLQLAESLILKRNTIRRSRGFDWSQSIPSRNAFDIWNNEDFISIARNRRILFEQYLGYFNSRRWSTMVFHKVTPQDSPISFPVWVDRPAGFKRRMWERGIEVAQWWNPLPREIGEGHFPNSRRASKFLFHLPLNLNLRDEDIKTVVNAVKECC